MADRYVAQLQRFGGPHVPTTWAGFIYDTSRRRADWTDEPKHAFAFVEGTDHFRSRDTAERVTRTRLSHMNREPAPEPAAPSRRNPGRRGKLSPAQVEAIREQIAANRRPSEIARDFGISPAMVTYIRAGKRHRR